MTIVRRKAYVRCDQCQLARINGVLCHEIGCPDAWRSYTYECKLCHEDFKPKSRHQRYCRTCLRWNEFDHYPLSKLTRAEIEKRYSKDAKTLAKRK